MGLPLSYVTEQQTQKNWRVCPKLKKTAMTVCWFVFNTCASTSRPHGESFQQTAVCCHARSFAKFLKKHDTAPLGNTVWDNEARSWLLGHVLTFVQCSNRVFVFLNSVHSFRLTVFFSSSSLISKRILIRLFRSLSAFPKNIDKKYKVFVVKRARAPRTGYYHTYVHRLYFRF